MKKIAIILICTILVILGFSSNSVNAATKTQHIIINKANNKLAFYENGKLIKVYSVATGKKNSYTPEGTFKIVQKIKNRPYYSGNIKGGDPKNPLGDRWIGLDVPGTGGGVYAIHGNNNEKSIGTYASAGCIRMHNKEVRELYDRVQMNTVVIVANDTKSSFYQIAKRNRIVK